MDAIYSAIGKFLGWLDSLCGSYVLALFIFAIIVELLMIPFSIRQQKNSIKQAKLRPKEMAIRKKYAGSKDPQVQQKITQEIQEMYTKEGFNPMGGCLPLLIQFPIIIILYNTVINPLRHMMGMAATHVTGLVEYVNTTFGVKFDTRNTIGIINYISENGGVSHVEGIKDYVSETVTDGAAIYESVLSAFERVPNFNLFGMNLGETPDLHSFGWLWLIPILTFGVYFASMKLNRKLTYQPTAASDAQAGCSNNIMDISMPLMSVWISFMVPAVIGVYWIFKSILTTLKQFVMFRLMPIPKFTEEDYKAAEREMKNKKSSGNRNYTPSGTKPRSLHHIDDDDEEPAPAPEKKSKGSSLVAQAPVKKDEEKAEAEETAEPAPEQSDETPSDTEKNDNE
ncbi:MAG: YidC/Oxa1 family membrane protein insertase [Oscillospiraceae bacterium]|nr:YidC/Oxa1 family membrane protein insertase [Oscillospiraceae bacterium]